jgi:CheY-like chemotaxis protein
MTTLEGLPIATAHLPRAPFPLVCLDRPGTERTSRPCPGSARPGVESDRMQGAVARGGARAEPSTTTNTSRPAVRKGRVLLVDDEPFIGTALQRLLRAEHDLTAVSSGAHALERITRGDDFDVILCDLRMPLMNGIELFQRLREVAPEMAERTIFFTGAAITADMRAFLENVKNELLEKPFEPDALRATLRRFIPDDPDDGSR